MQPTYRLVVIGPGDEVLDTISLDGHDLERQLCQAGIGDLVAAGMGGAHRAACAALPELDDDGEPIQ